MIKKIELKYKNTFHNEISADYSLFFWKKRKKYYKKDYFIRRRKSIWKQFTRCRVTKIYLIDKNLWYAAKTGVSTKTIKNKIITDTFLDKQKQLQFIYND